MVRYLVVLAVLAGGVTPAPGDDAEKELGRLKGEWAATAWELSGEVIPAAELKKQPIVYRFDGARLMVSVPAKTGKDIEIEVRVDPSKSPKRMDLISSNTPNGRQIQEAIYRLDGDELTLCIPNPRGEGPPKEFKAPKGSDLLLVTFRRAKKPHSSLRLYVESAGAWNEDRGTRSCHFPKRFSVRRSSSANSRSPWAVRTRIKNSRHSRSPGSRSSRR